MNKFLIRFSLLFLYILTTGCGNQQEYLSHDTQEEMALKRIVNDSSGQQVLHITKKTPRPQKKKVYTWYRNHKISTTMGNYSGVLLNDDYEKFDTNQILQLKGNYKKGVRVGRWQQWHTDGNLYTIHHYDTKGRLHGSSEEYNTQKGLLAKGRYRHGKKQGTWIQGTDTLSYKKGQVFVKDTLRASFLNRLFKKKDDKQKEASQDTKTETAPRPNFFQRLFTKKATKNTKD